MRVRVTLSVGDYERFVIAKYFSRAARPDTPDRRRRRATRVQVRRFVRAALEKAITDQARDLPTRTRTTARRLAQGRPPREALPPLKEEQRSLIW